MELINVLVAGVSEWLPIILQVVGVFALIATKTPNTVDDRIGQLLMDAVNFLGANVGAAKNDPSLPAPPV